MKVTGKLTGKLTVIERLKSSVSGNARYLLLISDTVCRTKPDSCIADKAYNLDGDTVVADVAMYRGKLHLTSLDKVQS